MPAPLGPGAGIDVPFTGNGSDTGFIREPAGTCHSISGDVLVRGGLAEGKHVGTGDDRGNVVDHDDEAGRAVAAIALVAGIALVLIGAFGMVAGLKPAVWVTVVGVVVSIGVAVAIRSRDK